MPFLNGATYEPIPRLLLPRFLDDQKGISHAGNVMLTVNYGLQTLEQTASTSIHWGLVPEAYANFGYVGVAALAIVLGAFYAFVGNMTEGVPLTSLRFVLGILIMGAATRADTMGVFVTTQFQGVVGACLGALVLMTREANPLAGKEKEEVRRRAGAVGKSKGGKVEKWEGGMAGDVEEMKARLRSIYGTYRPLPKWASFRHRAIMLEIEKLEAQLKANHESQQASHESRRHFR